VLGNRPPKDGDGENYAALFEALREMGYAGRITMEASCADFEREAVDALRRLKEGENRI